MFWVRDGDELAGRPPCGPLAAWRCARSRKRQSFQWGSRGASANARGARSGLKTRFVRGCPCDKRQKPEPTQVRIGLRHLRHSSVKRSVHAPCAATDLKRKIARPKKRPPIPATAKNSGHTTRDPRRDRGSIARTRRNASRAKPALPSRATA